MQFAFRYIKINLGVKVYYWDLVLVGAWGELNRFIIFE